MSRRGVTDWRKTAKGAHHWLDEAAHIERRLGELVAAAAKLDPTDAAAAVAKAAEIERLIGRFEEIRAKILAEKQCLDVWIQSETSGLLGRMMEREFRGQFAEQYEIYEQPLEATLDGAAYFRQRLAEIAPVTEDGLVRCLGGHANHSSRQSCLVCGTRLDMDIADFDGELG